MGAVEGTHADVAPALHPGTAGHLEARRVGRALGARAAELFASLDGRLRGDVAVACGLREVDLDRDPSIDGVTLPRRPAVGAALVAGAFENETPVIHRVPPFRPGVPRRRADGPQGGKRVLGGPFQRLVLPLSGFPASCPCRSCGWAEPRSSACPSSSRSRRAAASPRRWRPRPGLTASTRSSCRRSPTSTRATARRPRSTRSSATRAGTRSTARAPSRSWPPTPSGWRARWCGPVTSATCCPTGPSTCTTVPTCRRRS